MKILKGMVFLISWAEFFFCCRAKVFLFRENLKCTDVLIFLHHLYFIQWKYKMWASWWKTCSLSSNKQVNQPWWNMLLNICWRMTIFKSPNKKGTLKYWCWGKIMYQSHQLLHTMINPSCLFYMNCTEIKTVQCIFYFWKWDLIVRDI